MKKILAKLLFILTIIVCSQTLIAQPPPPPSGGHGSNNNQPAGGAPIGSGLFILLGLGVAYGGKKVYDMRKEILEE